MKLLDVFDRLPDLYGRTTFIVAAAISSVIAARLCFASGVRTIWPAVPAMLLSVALAWLWIRAEKQIRPAWKTWGLMAACAFPFILTSLLMGSPSSAGFPAVFALLFGLVIGQMRDLQRRLTDRNDVTEDLPVHTIFHRELGWMSAVLFVFGVITLWPWLGERYGNGYFWVLVCGVLVPMLFFWGRLRQPRHEGSVAALYRFNRLMPYLGFIFLLAIAVG
ncbi:MAG: hypothetical protein PHI18_01780 [bacterium]|nr:hypothetical protein [bacterium]